MEQILTRNRIFVSQHFQLRINFKFFQFVNAKQ